MDTSNVLSALALVAAFAFGMAAHFRTKAVSDLSERIAKIEARVETYFDAQEKYNALILHRDDDEHKIDELLEKREQLEPLREEEQELLARKLEEIIRNPNEMPGKRAAAVNMLSVRKARNAKCS